ncbi:hypothetical protein BJX70DRAFT_359418 [Aspergillus crustosus]
MSLSFSLVFLPTPTLTVLLLVGKRLTLALVCNDDLHWDLCNLASLHAIGVLSDNQTAIDQAITYFPRRVRNGRIEQHNLDRARGRRQREAARAGARGRPRPGPQSARLRAAGGSSHSRHITRARMCLPGTIL